MRFDFGDWGYSRTLILSPTSFPRFDYVRPYLIFPAAETVYVKIYEKCHFPSFIPFLLASIWLVLRSNQPCKLQMGRIFSRIRRGLKRSSSDEMVMAKLPPSTPSRSPSPFRLPPPSVLPPPLGPTSPPRSPSPFKLPPPSVQQAPIRSPSPPRAPSPPQYCKSRFPCGVVQQRSLSLTPL